MNLIQFLWQQTELAWKQRNTEIHDKDSEQAKAHELRNLECRLKAVYSLRDGVKHYDKTIFDTSIDDMLRLPAHRITKWLNIYEPYMRHRYRINTTNREQNQKQITDFFTAKQRNEQTKKTRSNNCTNSPTNTSDTHNPA